MQKIQGKIKVYFMNSTAILQLSIYLHLLPGEGLVYRRLISIYLSTTLSVDPLIIQFTRIS
jgi:hypothetical protein